MQKISPFLWFEDKAEEAVEFYVSVFPGAKITSRTTFSDDVPGPPGKVMSLSFKLFGQEFIALNGGPVDNEAFDTTFTGAISFLVYCDTQAEIDEYWEKLGDGGKPGPCGWITDRYGVTWQIVPATLTKLLNDPDPEKAGRVTRAMLKMKKIDIAALESARNET